MSRRLRFAVALLLVAPSGCAQSAQLIPPAFSAPAAPRARAPLVVDGSSHLVVLEYEAWFGPHAVTFQHAEAMPILQSTDMQGVGGGYDSTDPHVIERHLRWIQYMGIDAASIDLTNNVGCIFSTGLVSPEFCNPATEQFRNFNRRIRGNTGNLYPAWSKLGSPVKLLPLLGCQSRRDLRKGSDGQPGFQKEVAYFARLMQQSPALNVVYAGHPLMLVYVGTPVNLTILRGCKGVLREGGLDRRYTFRIVGGFLDSQPEFWADPSETPNGPIEIAPQYQFWSYIDRLKPRLSLYPTYSVMRGDQPENFTASIATPGQRGWGCPRPKLCRGDATRYGQSKKRYVTFDRFMSLAAELRPTFLILHQFNEFVRPDEGWDAQTSNDLEPTRMPKGWGYGGITTVRNAIAAYRRAANAGLPSTP